MWNKLMISAAKLKIKAAENQRTVNLLEKLKKEGLGTNQVEEFAKTDMGTGWRAERRRRTMVRCMMRGKVEDARTTLAMVKVRGEKKMEYLERRWGHNQAIMTTFKGIVQEQVEDAWKDKGEKYERKLKHLRRKWRKKNVERNESMGGEWRGVKIGDRELEEEEEERRDIERVKPVLKFGGAATSAEEDSLLVLPSKFAMYDPISVEKVEVSLQVAMTKARWELRSRRERGEEEEQEWSEEWEVEQQEAKAVYDPVDEVFGMADRKVTDMDVCRSTIMPQAGPAQEEVIMANMVTRGLDCVRGYVKEKCDKKGYPREQNLSEANSKGMKSLLDRTKNKEIVVTQTDKSGRLAVSKRENYIQAMEPHFIQYPEQSWEERRSLEDTVNAHTIQVGRILRIGEKWGHWSRVKSSIISHFSAVPLLHGYVKDHKPLPPAEPPSEHPVPQMRPVCSVLESNNSALSSILAEVCTTLGDTMDKEIETNCLSTEEMIVGMEKVNLRKEEINKLVIMSMDVEKMFPRMEAGEVARVVGEEYRRSSLRVEVDAEALGLYLAIMVEREELVARGLGEVVHTRKRGQGGAGEKAGHHHRRGGAGERARGQEVVLPSPAHPHQGGGEGDGGHVLGDRHQGGPRQAPAVL